MTIYQSDKIHVAVVVSNNDPTKSAILTVKCPEIGNEPFEVIYTSPYFTQNGGGMIAIPEPGSKILLFADRDSGKCYYLSTIVEEPDNSQSGGLLDWDLIKDKYLYTERERPQKVDLTNSFGAGLEISRRFLPNYISSKVELKSEGGKKIILSDSPRSDAVIIRNEHGDGVIVTSDASDIHGERSIEFKCKGMQRLVVLQSELDIFIVDGRDINIENYSTGAYAIPGTNGKFGNINLRSHNADINISSRAEDGRIFIVTPKARIQIGPDGSVSIESQGDVQINTQGDLDLKAGNAVRIQGQSVDIKSNSDIRLESSGAISSKAGGNNSLDGSQLHLNSGLSVNAVEAQIAELDRNDYNE